MDINDPHLDVVDGCLLLLDLIVGHSLLFRRGSSLDLAFSCERYRCRACDGGFLFALDCPADGRKRKIVGGVGSVGRGVKR